MYRIILAAAVFGLLPALAEAGGGTKGRTGNIQVQNTSGQAIGVIVDPPANLTPDNFVAAGGRLVGPNAATTFTNLRVGTRSVLIQPLDSANQPTGSPQIRSVNVVAGQTATTAFQ